MKPSIFRATEGWGGFPPMEMPEFAREYTLCRIIPVRSSPDFSGIHGGNGLIGPVVLGWRRAAWGGGGEHAGAQAHAHAPARRTAHPPAHRQSSTMPCKRAHSLFHLSDKHPFGLQGLARIVGRTQAVVQGENCSDNCADNCADKPVCKALVLAMLRNMRRCRCADNCSAICADTKVKKKG